MRCIFVCRLELKISLMKHFILCIITAAFITSSFGQTAFKKNDQFRFQMVTNQANVPQGTDLYKENVSGKAAG